MNNPFPDLPHQLGVYSLTRLIELRENSALYEARQPHVDRAVVLEVLAPDAPHCAEVTFLAQARLRVASSELPHVAGVFESLRADGVWFLTQELPPGRSLADIAAAYEELTIPQICRYIIAAADMYLLCHQVELAAMPLAPSSMFVSPEGDIQFLSPLVEGHSDYPAYQQQAVAMALWAVCPRAQVPGLGRITTLLQWLNEGVEGQWLSWDDIRSTAATILSQLEGADTSKQPRQPLRDKPCIKAVRQFITRWGAYTAGAAAVIIGMSSLGSLYGMGAPRRLPTTTDAGILCRDGNVYEIVSRRPVTVQEYSQFLQQLDTMEEAQLSALLGMLPDRNMELTPAYWDEQLERAGSSPDTPVTGVNFWHASLYAQFHGGRVATAPQLQIAIQHGDTGCELEWSRSESTGPQSGIYDENSLLLVNKAGTPVPVSSREWNHASCGFRLATPQPTH
ncbi:MAG: SUMF1/EgtB/PvdO family nonheme iron enzyme [Akkermansia sp.]|nr:SUMF1/EgtB/PvdO family nonheme iron enzyme [Akkermansia sp.]